MTLSEYRLLFRFATGLLILLAASPALGRLLILPNNESFTELWILDRNYKAEDYPFNTARSMNQSLILGIENHLRKFAYYVVEVKFRNKTQSAPNSFNHTPSSLPALFTITAFVADGEVWERHLTFSFDFECNYTDTETPPPVEFVSLAIDNYTVNIGNTTVAWDPELRGFPGNLFFELWIYDPAANRFQYHERFVSLWLNMTG